MPSISLPATAGTGHPLEIPYHEIGEPGKGPRIALATGLCGDELNGVFVLSRLVDYLQEIAGGRRLGQRLRTQVTIIPSVLPLEADLRKRHQGGSAASVNEAWAEQQTAHTLLQTMRAAYYRIEIGSSHPALETLPQVCLYRCSDDERESAFLFGLPAIIEGPDDALLPGTLAHGWQELGGQNFALRAGQVGSLQPHHCERLFRAIISFLDRTGILEGIELSEEEEDTHYYAPNQALPLVSEVTGLFVSKMEVGRWVRAGEPVGSVYDAFDGHVRAEIRAPVAGLVSSIRRQPVLRIGDLIARIQTHEPLLQ